MIFKKNIADKMQTEVFDLLENFRKNLDTNLKENDLGGYVNKQFETRARSAKIKKDNANNNMNIGYAFAGAGILSAAMGSVVLATTSIVGGAVLLGATSGVVVPALAFIGINKLIKNHYESVENKNAMRAVNDSVVVRTKFEKGLNKALKGLNDKDYKEIVDNVSITDLKNSDIKSFDAKAEKFMSLVKEKSDEGGIFKSKKSDELENKILKLMEVHKKDLDYAGKALMARDKAEKANDFMNNSLLSAASSVGAGIAGYAALSSLGGALGTLVGGVVLSGGIAIAVPALALMGVSKLVKSYHESVADKNEPMDHKIKASYDVKSSFMEKINKIIGSDTEMSQLIHSKGIKDDLASGVNVEENTKKLLEIVRESKNKVVVNTTKESKLGY